MRSAVSILAIKWDTIVILLASGRVICNGRSRNQSLFARSCVVWFHKTHLLFPSQMGTLARCCDAKWCWLVSSGGSQAIVYLFELSSSRLDRGAYCTVCGWMGGPGDKMLARLDCETCHQQVRQREVSSRHRTSAAGSSRGQLAEGVHFLLCQKQDQPRKVSVQQICKSDQSTRGRVATEQIAPSQLIVITKSVLSVLFHNISGAPPEKEWRNPKRGEAKTARLNNSPERFVRYIHPFLILKSL